MGHADIGTSRKERAIVWTQWVRQPQTLWIRRALFQVHLWTGLAIGLYIVLLSVTGSALVYRVELDRAFATPRPTYDANAKRLTPDEMRQAAERAYPGWTITRVGDRITRRNPTIEVWAERGTGTNAEKKERLFDPYTGADLGESVTQGEYFLLWLARLHDDLLFDRDGRWWNGAGSAVMTVICLTGLVIWWPGRARWKRSLGIKWSSGWKRFNWDMHSALGFWLFLFMLMWGISGFYLGIPEPFSDFVDRISSPDDFLGERPGDIVLSWLTRLHFGRWRGVPALKAVWAVLGLVPAVMFVTGVIMWWNRVMKRRGSGEPVEESQARG